MNEIMEALIGMAVVTGFIAVWFLLGFLTLVVKTIICMIKERRSK